MPSVSNDKAMCINDADAMEYIASRTAKSILVRARDHQDDLVVLHVEDNLGIEKQISVQTVHGGHLVKSGARYEIVNHICAHCLRSALVRMMLSIGA